MKKQINNHINFIEFPSKSIDDLIKTRQFYQDIFGWSFKEWGDDYIDTSDSGVSCGINADSGQNSHAPLIVIYVKDLEDIRKQISSAGCKISREIFEFPGGRRFHYIDPAGNELAVWSDIE
jgi:uncharacterized protein